MKKQRSKLFERWFIHHKFPTQIDAPKSSWKKVSLKNLVNFKKGKKLAGDSVDSGLYPLFSASFETKKINEYSFDQESLLLTLSGKIFIKYYSGKFDATSEVAVFSASKDKMFWLLETMNFQKYIFNRVAQGTGLKHLSTAWLKDFELILPPDNLLNLFNKFAEPIQKHIDNLEKKINTFQIIKQELIERIYSQNLEIY